MEGKKNVYPFPLDVASDESVAQAASFVASRSPNGTVKCCVLFSFSEKCLIFPSFFFFFFQAFGL